MKDTYIQRGEPNKSILRALKSVRGTILVHNEEELIDAITPWIDVFNQIPSLIGMLVTDPISTFSEMGIEIEGNFLKQLNDRVCAKQLSSNDYELISKNIKLPNQILDLTLKVEDPRVDNKDLKSKCCIGKKELSKLSSEAFYSSYNFIKNRKSYSNKNLKAIVLSNSFITEGIKSHISSTIRDAVDKGGINETPFGYIKTFYDRYHLRLDTTKFDQINILSTGSGARGIAYVNLPVQIEIEAYGGSLLGNVRVNVLITRVGILQATNSNEMTLNLKNGSFNEPVDLSEIIDNVMNARQKIEEDEGEYYFENCLREAEMRVNDIRNVLEEWFQSKLVSLPFVQLIDTSVDMGDASILRHPISPSSGISLIFGDLNIWDKIKKWLIEKFPELKDVTSITIEDVSKLVEDLVNTGEAFVKIAEQISDYGEICPDDGPVCITSVPIPKPKFDENPPTPGITFEISGRGVYKFLFFRIGFGYVFDVRFYCENGVLKDEVVDVTVNIEDGWKFLIVLIGTALGAITGGTAIGITAIVTGAVVGAIAGAIGVKVAEDVAGGQAGGQFLGNSFFGSLKVGDLEVESDLVCEVFEFIDDLQSLAHLFGIELDDL